MRQLLKAEEKENLFKDTADGFLSKEELMKKYNLTWRQIKHLYYHYNIDFKRDFTRVSQENRIFIMENFQKYGTKYCAEKLNKTPETINKWIKKLGIKRLTVKSTEMIDGKFTCSHCKILKSPENFRRQKYSKNGLFSWCNTCVLELKAKQRADLLKDDNKRKIVWLKKSIWGAGKRAGKRNQDFNLDFESLINQIPEFCPVLGIKLTFLGTNGSKSSSASLDRIDNNKSYTKDNVIVISYRANLLKNNSSPDEREKIYNFYKNLSQKNEDYSI